jgi:drug/metabolite transporter (DMT)-like permease
MHESGTVRKTSAGQSAALPVIALILANVTLAFGPWFVRLADTGPVATGFWRLALAFPILFAAAWGTGWRPRSLTGPLIATLGIGGLCFAADLASWHLGILRTTLANATLFGNSATLFYPVYGFIIARALPSRMQAVALAMALAGAALLMGRSYELSPQNFVGDALCLIAGLLYTGYFILLARARTTLAPFPALALSSLASVLPLLLFAFALNERVWPHDWAPLIGVALSSQVIGQGLMIYALGNLSPLVIGIALLTQPIVSGTIGWFAYDEVLGAPDIAGAVLVGLALVLVRRGRAPAQLAPVGGETR